MHLHVHVKRRPVQDAKFTGTYSAKTKAGKKVEFTATVEAPDVYTAGDRMKELAEQKFGKDLFYPVIKFGAARLPAGSQSQKISRKAGPEEE